MARRITFEIVTRAQTRGLNQLARALADITKNAKKLNNDLKLDSLGEELNKVNATGRRTSQVMARAGRAIKRDLGDQSERAAKNVETLQTRFRGLSKDISTIDRSRNRLKSLADEIAESEERLARARQDVADASTRLRRAERDPNRTTEQIEEATRAYNESSKAVLRAENAHTKLHDSLRKTMQEAIDAERRVTDLEDSIEALRHTAGGEDILKKLLPPQSAQQLRVARDSLNSLQNVMDQTLKTDRGRIGQITSGFNALRNQLTQLGPTVKNVKNLSNEIQAMARLDTQDIMRGIGNADTAIRQTTKMMNDQAEAAIRIQGQNQRLAQSMTRWVAAESQANSVLASGNTAMLERRRAQQMLTRAISEASSVETTAAKQQEALLARRRTLMQEQLSLVNRINAAQSQLVQRQVGTAAYREMEGTLNRLRTAYSNIDQAIDENSANIRQNQTVMSNASNAVEQMTRSTRQWQDAMQSLVASSRQNPFQGMIQSIQQLNQFAMRMAATFTSRVRGAITAVANASRSFVNSSASLFAGLQRALQSTGSYFDRFANRVARSMDRARSSMMEMYAAGFGLMQVGREINQFGVQGFRMMGRSLEGFMEYERARIQAGVAGAQPVDARGNTIESGPATTYTIDSRIIDQLIFELQRGTMTPEWLGGSGKRIPVAFDARELAEGLYYYSSAIGVPITDVNMRDVGSVVTTMMQMARVTNTDVEAATKGVLNILMEFGYDPRAIGPTASADQRAASAREQANVAAQVGYLANISTMEVSDIIETFKMVGPMANILSGGTPGAGLNDTFLLAFLASEVGLRGGNTGRGINRALTSLLDPTKKMMGLFEEYFGIASEEEYRAEFFEGGALKGGILGFLQRVADTVPDEQQAQFLAEMFTENATRTLVGMMGEFTKADGLDQWIEDIGGGNPLLWLESAVAETANSVNGWFTFMQNGWFQLQAAMIGSIQGPLMAGFQLLGEFFFELAQSINDFPIIGQVMSAIVTAVMSFAAVGGTILMMAGGILLLGRAFAMLGGFVLPFIRMIAMAAGTLAVLTPLLLLAGAAVGLAVIAFQNNVFGIQDALGSLVSFFSDFEGNIVPLVERIFETFARIGDAIRIFFESILLGGDLPSASRNSLFAAIESIFGDFLGAEIINKLMQLREALGPTRDAVREFLSDSTFDVTQIDQAGRAIQGFFEQVFLGQMAPTSVQGMIDLGEAFGLTDLPVQIAIAGNAFRGFIEQAVGFGVQVAQVWTAMGAQIYSNLARILAGGGGLGAIFASISTVLQGVAQGIIAAFTGILASVAFVTDRIADFADSIRAAEAQGRTFMGMAVTFNGVLRAIGVTIGVVLGARLALAFSPLAAILVRIIPMLMTVSSLMVGFAARFLIVAANIAITTAAFVAHIAVMAAYGAAMMVAQAASILFSIAQATNAANAGVFATAMAVGIAAITGNAAAMTAAAAANALFSTTLGLALGVVALFVGALFGVAAIITAAAGAMFIWVAATQGLGAALQGAVSFVMGLWSGLQFGIAVVATFVGWIHTLAAAIASVTGVGNAFSVMGFMVGATLSAIMLLIVGLTGALAVMAAMWIASWAAANIGPILVVAAIGLIVYAIYELIGLLQSIDWGGFFEGLASAAETAFDAVILSAASMIDSITGVFAEGVEAVLNTALEAAQNAGLAGGLITRLSGGRDSVDIQPTNFAEQIADAQAAERNLERLQDTARGLGRTPARLRVEVEGEDEVEGLMGFLDDIGIGGPAREFMIAIGLDPNSFDLSDLSSVDLMEFMQTPEGMKFDAAAVDFGFSDLMTKYQEDLQAWEMYRARVDAGMDPLDARRFFEANEIAIPTERPDMMDYFGPIADQAAQDEAAAEQLLQETMQKWESAVQGLGDMALPDMFSALYDPLTGAGGRSLISFMSEVGEGIIANAQEGGGAEWLNMNELLADVAGTGVALDENLVGRNLHTALRPALEIIQRQTGVAMEDLLADIPIFSAPEQFQNIATVDMVQGISSLVENLGTEMYETVDVALAGLINQNTGEQFFQYGLDWSELNNFAIGQAILGHDWNLADFVAEVMDISTEQANQVLLDAGLSQEAINAFSDNMYNGLEEAVLSNAGAFNVLTEEQFQWLHDATRGFKENVIRMSESEFGEMSDTMKLILTNMGYTFVITDLIPADAYAAVQQQIDDFVAFVNESGQNITAGLEGANFTMEGDPREWLKVDEFYDATGELMVVLQDLDGTQVTIPAAELSEFESSLSSAEALAAEWGTRIRAAFLSGFTSAIAGGGGVSAGMGGGTGALTGLFAGLIQDPNANAMEALGLPETAKLKVEADTTEAVAAIREITDQFSGSGSEFTITPQVEMGAVNDAVMSVGLGLQALGLMQIPINLDAAAAAAAITAVGRGIEALGLIEIEIDLKINTEAAERAIRTVGNPAAGGGGVAGMEEFKVPVVAQIVGLEMDALFAGAQGIRVPVVAFINGFEVDGLFGAQLRVPVTAFINSFEVDALYGGEVRVPVTAYINSFESDALYGGVIRVPVTAYINSFEVDSIFGIQLRVPVTAYVNGFEFDAVFQDIRVPVTAYVNSLEVDALYGAGDLRIPVVAEVTQTGADQVASVIGSVIGAARELAVTWTATIAETGASGAATSIGNAIGVARVYAVTWTAGITVLGEATVVGAIGRAINTARVFATTWAATLSVNDNASSTIRSAINLLDSFDGRRAVSTITTRQITEIGTRNIGATAATGGWRSGGQAVLVGEEGPEVVWFPTNGYVFTAPETDQMLSEGLGVTNPFVSRESGGSGAAPQEVHVTASNTGDTYNFYGDIKIESPQAAEAWFDEMDRRSGKRVAMARRGMRAVDDMSTW